MRKPSMRATPILLAIGLVTGSLATSIVATAVAPTTSAAATQGATAYITTSTALVAVNTATGAVSARFGGISVGEVSVAITPDGRTAYTTDNINGDLVPIDLTTGTVGGHIHVLDPKGSSQLSGDYQNNLAITPDGSTAYVTDANHNLLIPVDLATATPEPPIHVQEFPDLVVITPDGKTVYVGSDDSAHPVVTPVSTATKIAGAPITVKKAPAGLVVTPDSKTLYVTNVAADTVTPIATATNKPGPPIKAGRFPSAIAITPDGKTVYVTDVGSNTLTPIATATNTAGKPITVGTAPFNIAITPDGKTAYVVLRSTEKSGVISAINLATGKARAPVKVGQFPIRVAMSPDQAPVAALSVVPAAAGSGVATQFDASGSVAPTSPIVSYAWDFGDGTKQTTSVPTISHLYSQANTYSASVTETDAVGTSTSQVFTGQTMSRNGGPTAAATVSVVIVSCTTNQTCDATISAAASKSTPPQTIEATGSPSDPIGTLQVAVAPAKLICKNVDATVAPVVEMNDTGFSTTTALTVKTTLQNTIRPSSHQVCFNSTIPYLSQTNPTIPKAGTALLLDCATVSNVPPCVLSKSQVGPDVVVITLVPGGDPTLKVVAPPPARINLPVVPNGKLKKSYSAHLQTTGGIPPIVWKVLHGNLPKGLSYDARTGAITGKPTAKARSTFVMQASDAESPPETAQMTVSITVS